MSPVKNHFGIFLGVSFLICGIDASYPRNPADGLAQYGDFCFGVSSCCQRMGLNVNHSMTITVSSQYRGQPVSWSHGPERAALFQLFDGVGSAGWAPATQDTSQWIQVDFGSPRKITGVLLQGRAQHYEHWVTSFRVQFSNDGEVFVSTRTFEGNTDRSSVNRRMFDNPIVARYFRINPITWHGFITMRFDLIGCDI